MLCLEPASAPRVDLPAGQLTAAHVELELPGVLGKPTLAQGRQADRAALRATTLASGETLVTQTGCGVVDDG
jgi:hypothetical protein